MQAGTFACRAVPITTFRTTVDFCRSCTVESSSPLVGGHDRTLQRLEDEQNDDIIAESLQKEIDQLECHIVRMKRSQNVASVFDAYLENKTWSSLADLLLRLYNHLNVADPIKVSERPVLYSCIIRADIDDVLLLNFFVRFA